MWLFVILFLFIVGIFVGFVWGVLDVDVLFGNLLFLVVLLLVVIILFEGLLILKFCDIVGYGNMVRNFCSIGVVVIWGIVVVVVYYSLNIFW